MSRRKGKLGRLLKTAPQCYAWAVVAGCAGDVNQEHPLSEGLRRGKRLRVVINRLPPGTDRWRQTFDKEVSAKQASALVLCEKHNGDLSKADEEAVRMSGALRELAERSRSTIIQPLETVTIAGHLFGRWLCKYYSGSMAMTGQTAHPDFVRYAFGEKTHRRLYFLFPAELNQALRLGDTSNMPLQTYRTDGGHPEAFRVTFEGLHVVVSTIKGGPHMKEVFDELPYPDGTRIIDRLKVLRMPEVHFRILLDWGGDPDDARILSPSGMPTPVRE